jgi:hypothetical protein
MAYRQVGGSDARNFQPAHLDNIELNTHYDSGAYNYAPPAGKPPSQATGGDSKHDDDAKPFFQPTTQPMPPPGSNWPVQSQRVATVTPLRAFLLFFDGLLASVPIMFVGKLSQSIYLVRCLEACIECISMNLYHDPSQYFSGTRINTTQHLH